MLRYTSAFWNYYERKSRCWNEICVLFGMFPYGIIDWKNQSLLLDVMVGDYFSFHWVEWRYCFSVLCGSVDSTVSIECSHSKIQIQKVRRIKRGSKKIDCKTSFCNCPATLFLLRTCPWFQVINISRHKKTFVMTITRTDNSGIPQHDIDIKFYFVRS